MPFSDRGNRDSSTRSRFSTQGLESRSVLTADKKACPGPSAASQQHGDDQRCFATGRSSHSNTSISGIRLPPLPLVRRAWGRTAADFGKLSKQPRRIARFPGHGASEAPGRPASRLGPPPRRRSTSAKVHASMARSNARSASRAATPVEAADCLEVLSPSRPERAAVVPGGRIAGVQPSPARPNKSAVASRSWSLWPCIKLSQAARLAESIASRNRYAVRAASGKSDADSRAARACRAATGELGSARRARCQASPGGQWAAGSANDSSLRESRASMVHPARSLASAEFPS